MYLQRLVNLEVLKEIQLGCVVVELLHCKAVGVAIMK